MGAEGAVPAGALSVGGQAPEPSSPVSSSLSS
jgi:hypothetical protein